MLDKHTPDGERLVELQTGLEAWTPGRWKLVSELGLGSFGRVLKVVSRVDGCARRGGMVRVGF